MKEPVKRLRQTIAIAIIFLVVYTAIMLSVEQRYNRELVMADSVNKTESVRGMIEGYGKTADEIGRGFREDENARVRLETIRLASQIVDGEFVGGASWDEQHGSPRSWREGGAAAGGGRPISHAWSRHGNQRV